MIQIQRNKFYAMSQNDKVHVYRGESAKSAWRINGMSDPILFCTDVTMNGWHLGDDLFEIDDGHLPGYRPFCTGHELESMMDDYNVNHAVSV